jgi:serine/threonine protein kinase
MFILTYPCFVYIEIDEVVEKLGEEFFGTLYKVKDVSKKSLFLAKQLYSANDEKVVKRILGELKCLVSVDSPYIIKIVDVSVVENTIIIVMELYDYCKNIETLFRKCEKENLLLEERVCV